MKNDANLWKMRTIDAWELQELKKKTFKGTCWDPTEVSETGESGTVYWEFPISSGLTDEAICFVLNSLGYSLSLVDDNPANTGPYDCTGNTGTTRLYIDRKGDCIYAQYSWYLDI